MESLESRQLLSAVAGLRHARADQSVSLSGTYSGTLHIPGKAANGTPDRTFSITVISDTPDGRITGGINIQSLGTFAFHGNVSHRQLLGIFHDAAGASAGEVIAKVSANGAFISGEVIDQTGSQRTTGKFTAAPGGAAVSIDSIPPVVGSTTSASTFQQQNLIGSYSGRTHLSGPRVFMFSVSPETITMAVTLESDAGEVSGTLSLLNVNFNFDGIVNGDQLTFVLGGLGGGRGTALLVRSGGILEGVLTDTLPAGTIRGPFKLTNPSAISSGTGTGSTGAPTGSNLPGSIGGPTTITPTPTGGTTTTGTGTGTGTGLLG